MMHIVTKNWNAWYSPKRKLLLVTGEVDTPPGFSSFLEKMTNDESNEVSLELWILKGISIASKSQEVIYRETLLSNIKVKVVKIFYLKHKIGLIQRIWVV